MDIHAIHEAAPRKLEAAPQQKRIVTIFAGITVLSALLVTAINYVLSLQIAQTTGLSSMGLRSILSTIQSVLPIVQSIALMCLELGYTSAMLRIARGQYASPNGLRLGFDRFSSLMRCLILQWIIYMGVGIAAFYAAMMIFLHTPFGERLMESVAPYIQDTSLISSGAYLLDEAAQAQISEATTPLLVIFGILCLVILVPILYRFRMADYVIIDKPGIGGLAALRESRMIMKGNCLKLFRLDLSLWWYHLLTALTLALCYGDVILSFLGIEVGIHPDVLYYGFYAIYLTVQFAIAYGLRNRVDVSYALAYEQLRPKEAETSAVLGNIFQM